MSLENIREILQSRRFESRLGVNEDLWFEAKQKIAYDLDTAAGRYEFAKDICAFANGEGGFLLLGLRTDHLIEENTDRVVSIDLFPHADFDPPKYEGVLREYVYPRIANLSVAWIADSSQPDMGLGVIEVPPQDSERKYFLTANVFEGDRSIPQIVFGLSRRNKSANDPLSAQELHSMMQKGKSLMSEKLARVEEKIDALLHARSLPAKPTESSLERLDERIEQLFKDFAKS
jgi:predicted HTH transcriptional regulator